MKQPSLGTGTAQLRSGGSTVNTQHDADVAELRWASPATASGGACSGGRDSTGSAVHLSMNSTLVEQAIYNSSAMRSKASLQAARMRAAEIEAMPTPSRLVRSFPSAEGPPLTFAPTAGRTSCSVLCQPQSAQREAMEGVIPPALEPVIAVADGLQLSQSPRATCQAGLPGDPALVGSSPQDSLLACLVPPVVHQPAISELNTSMEGCLPEASVEPEHARVHQGSAEHARSTAAGANLRDMHQLSQPSEDWVQGVVVVLNSQSQPGHFLQQPHEFGRPAGDLLVATEPNTLVQTTQQSPEPKPFAPEHQQTIGAEQADKAPAAEPVVPFSSVEGRLPKEAFVHAEVTLEQTPSSTGKNKLVPAPDILPQPAVKEAVARWVPCKPSALCGEAGEGEQDPFNPWNHAPSILQKMLALAHRHSLLS